MTEADRSEESPPMAGEDGGIENESIVEEEEEEEEEEEDLDFNPFLKGTPSPEASSSLSSEIEALDDASSPKPTGEVQNFPVGDSEHGEEVVMQTSGSPEEGEESKLGKKRASSQQDEDFDDEDAICKRTRARYSLASFTLDELETFLQGSDDEDDLQNVDDEEEYRKFLAAVLNSGEGEEQLAQAEEIGDDDDEDEENDADFEIELEELLESDVDDSVRDKDRKIETRQNRSVRNKNKNKKLQVQMKRPLRPLLPSLPIGSMAPFPDSNGKALALQTVGMHQPSENPLINGFTPQQIGQLHCLIHEHLQLLIQVLCLCSFDSSRKHIVSQSQGFISEILHKCSEVRVWRSVPFPGICFNPHYMRPSATDDLISSAQAAELFWVPCVRGQMMSILDVAPLPLVGKFMEDICNAAKDYQRRIVESSFEYEKEPLFQLPYFPSQCEGNGDAAAPLTPGQGLPKKTLAASIVERAKKQSIALVPRDVSKLAQRFFPLFNPALFPHKPPPPPVANRILFTDAEDELLAFGMMECNTDWKAIQQRFLPCKSKHQIYIRQKNRCSSKAPENPIKAVRRMKTSPLTAEEIECIQEGLRVYKLDWLSIWKFVVPHRDPSLLPRQWRLALGTQKSYKQDAAKKERRQKSALNRRIKAADLLNQKMILDKEDNQLDSNNSQKVRDHFVDNPSEAYVHQAFLADWAPVSAYPSFPTNLMGKGSPGDSLRQCIRIGNQPNNSAVPGEAPHQNIYNHHQPRTISPFGRSTLSPTTTQRIQQPTHGMTSADISKPTISWWPYRTRKKIGTSLVKLAPELPAVNLPPSVRVISESAFRNNHSGAFSRVSSTKPDSGRDDSAPQLLEGERVNDSDLQMHPLLFKSPEAEGLSYNLSKSTTAGSSSSFSFFSGNPPHLNLSLFHNPRRVGDSSAKSIRTDESSSSASGGIDFHPLLQQADDGNSNLAMPILSICQTKAISPIERAHELDLEIHLSSASRNKNRVTRDGGGSLNQPISAKGSLKRPMAKDTRVTGTGDASRLESNNADSAASSKGRSSNIEDLGCQSQQEIVMEQEELSDSDEEFEENVEFECEEMADSEGEDDSGCKSIDDQQDETGNPNVPIQEVVPTPGEDTNNQLPCGNSSDPRIGSRSPLLKKLSLTMLGKDKSSYTWLSLDSAAPSQQHDDAAPGHRVESGPSGEWDVAGMAQQLSLGPLASSTVKKSRSRPTRRNTNLNTQIMSKESCPENSRGKER